MADNTSSSNDLFATSLIPGAPSQSMPSILSNLDFHSLQITQHQIEWDKFSGMVSISLVGNRG